MRKATAVVAELLAWVALHATDNIFSVVGLPNDVDTFAPFWVRCGSDLDYLALFLRVVI